MSRKQHLIGIGVITTLYTVYLLGIDAVLSQPMVTDVALGLGFVLLIVLVGALS